MNIIEKRYKYLWRDGVILYGIGKLGKECYDYLVNNLKLHILAICDKEEILYQGMKTIQYQDLINYPNDTNVIVTIKYETGKEICNLLKAKFNNVYDIRDINACRYYSVDYEDLFLNESLYEYCVPFNHYDSAYPDLKYVFSHREQIFKKEDKIKDIDFNETEQLNLLEEMKEYSSLSLKWDKERNEKYRYYYNNRYFSLADARLLNFMIKKYQTKKIIEIGSGLSTCVMLDTNDYSLNYNLDITCIEPYPKRLIENITQGGVKEQNNICLYQNVVQNVDLDLFKKLEENDMLFIDSSHVAKVGSDVMYEYFDILPVLKSGVIIHVHDMFYPFEYPEEWIKQGRAYNELYIVRALLMDSKKYKIIFFNDMMVKKYYEKYQDYWMGNYPIFGGSLWLQKL